MIFDSTGMKAFPRWSEMGEMDRAVASISGEDGKIVAYTNGCLVANKDHQLMPNGDSLNFNQPFYDYWLNCERGYPQGYNITILPDPRNSNNHYIIHDEASIVIDSSAGEVDFPHKKLNYSYIDMTQDNGLGDVTEKNITFLDQRTAVSHLTAIHHLNKTDWWIVKPAYRGEKYYKILLDQNGFSRIDSQYIGPKFETETDIINPTGVGSSKFSPDGKKLAYFSLVDGLHVYDFDRATGLLSNHKSLDWAPLHNQNINGDIEFSPNSRFVYLCNRENIYQIDLIESNLENGLIKVGEFEQSKTGGLFDYMSLGPDCRIYVRQIGAFQFDFSSINYPNEKGLDCDFRQGNVIMPEPPNLGNFPHFPRFRVDEDMPCCPTTITPVEDAPDLEEVICGDWYETVKIFGEKWCLNSSAYSEMRLYKKDNLELFYFERFVNDVGRGAFFDLNGYTVGRSETRDGVFTVYPDSIQDYELVRVLGDCHTGFPSCENIVYDCPDLMADIGDTCDDGDPDTTDDAVTQSCTCEGQIIYDCPDLMLDMGDSCDDGNPNTSNDTIDMNCDCVGNQIFDCPTLMADIADACDDGDLSTINDVVTQDCICLGTPIVPAVNCPGLTQELLCQLWFQDVLADITCPSSSCRITIFNMVDDQSGDVAYIYVEVIPMGQFGFGMIFNCHGVLAGTSEVSLTSIFDPPYFHQFTSVLVLSFTLGDDQCTDEDNDGFLAYEDCDDTNSQIYPGAIELCNNIDDNCNGQIDEGFTLVRYYLDSDEDGYGVPSPSLLSCAQPVGYALTFDDCDDNDSSVNPGVTEGPYNGKDDDCDPATPDDDLDGDGYLLSEDCDDLDEEINPGALEICDETDNNCNDEIDEGLQLLIGYADTDGDGYGSPLDSLENCVLPSGYVENNSDCDDTNTEINPSVMEVAYNGLDDDCDTTTPDDDLDGDGFLLLDDCNDLDSLINPAAEEIPNNGIDEDCDGMDLLNSTYDLNNIIINIFPNPTTGIVHIKKDGYINFRVSLFDTNGQLMISQLNSSYLNLENYAQGTYVLTLHDLDSENYIVERIILIK